MRREVAPRSVKLSLLLHIGLLLVAPGLEAEGEMEAPAAEPPPLHTFAIVYPIDHIFFDPVTEHAIRYGKERRVRIIAEAPANRNVNTQIGIMQSLIDEEVDGIALCATEPMALAPLVDEALAAGIPTITFESDIPSSSRLCFLGTDNYRAGVHLAHVLARELDYAGEVIVCTGLSTQMSLNERIRGIRETLRGEYPKVRIVDIRSGEGDPELTLATIEAQVADNPDFDAFISIDATGGPAAVSIWKAKGWTGEQRKIVTFDDMPDNLAGVRDGIVEAIISQKQWNWGPLIIDRLLDLIAGSAVPDYFDTGTVEIDTSNVDSYRHGE